MSDYRVLGLIPARGGSKGVHRKNIRDLGGRPLIGHTIEAGLNAESVTSVVVTTEDDEIANIAQNEGARVPFRRPDDLAADETATEPVVEHAIQTLEKKGETYEDIVLLQPTSPLRTADHIDQAYELYDAPKSDSLISVYQTHDVRWERGPEGAQPVSETERNARRQDREPKYVSNGALYMTNVDLFRRATSLTVGRTVLYEMDEANSVDIDTPFDLWLAERILEDWDGT